MSDPRGGSVGVAKRSAFGELLKPEGTFFRTANRQLSAYLSRLRVPPSDREDLIGEGWLRASKHREQFTSVEPAQLYCWLKRTVHRLAIDRIRRYAKHFCQAFDAGKDDPIDAAEAKRAELSELREWLNALLEIVSPGNETNVRLLCEHFFQRRSIKDLAQQFSMTVDAIDCRIRRLLKQLHELAEASSRTLDRRKRKRVGISF